MKMNFFLSLFMIVLLCACQSLDSKSYQRGQGDVGNFITTTVYHFGGNHPKTAPKDVPVFKQQWRYMDGKTESGTNFVQITMSRRAFSELEQWLISVYGEPAHKVAWTSRGTAYGAYDSHQIGARIQFFVNKEKTTCQIFQVSNHPRHKTE